MAEEKRKILIIDDDSFLLDMYALKFSQNNFEVLTAKSGTEVLEKLKKGLRPDIMLVDITMPEMNGFEMLERIEKEKLCPDCLKVVLSNKSEQRDIDKANQLGVVGYIVKASSTPAEVMSLVMKILEKK